MEEGGGEHNCAVFVANRIIIGAGADIAGWLSWPSVESEGRGERGRRGGIGVVPGTPAGGRDAGET